MYIHLERAAADLVSNPTIKVSMGTKMPPPPTPPTVPHADPRSPITVASTVLQLNSNFCTRYYQLRKQNQTPMASRFNTINSERLTGQTLSVVDR